MAYSIIDIQGVVGTSDTLLYATPSTKFSSIVNIKFNNPTNVAYTIEVYKVIDINSILLYKLSLDAGDFVDDTTMYNLTSETEIHALSDDPNTTFIISGNEIDIPPVLT